MNIHHDYYQGRTVMFTTPTKQHRLLAGFPGWGADNYAEFFGPIEVGMTATVVNVESHGSNPWTRLTLKFADGSRAAGVDPALVTITNTTTNN